MEERRMKSCEMMIKEELRKNHNLCLQAEADPEEI